ncbi:MAG: nucleotidyltransferase domain-containing protein [Deltaproteobacteria bacterium]|nr:MAG: nucleotidyltransferase domain-containing protein [Deltaproteobacteria bacterium]
MSKIKGRIKREIEEYITEIKQICPIEKVILFGSHAKEAINKNSDIDLAIFSRKINDENRLEFTTKFLVMITKFKLDIQPIAFSYQDYFDEENDFIRDEIRKKGIEIYSATQ